MKYYLLTILFVSILKISSSFAQCLEFAKNHCKPKLESYVHDGNFNSIVLNEGEQVELQKVFFRGQKYRLVIGAEDFLPRIHFKITDTDLNVMFDNAENNYIDYYDFELDYAKNLIISLDFEKNEDSEVNSKSGCVSILFGMQL